MRYCWCLWVSPTALLAETQDIPVVSLYLLDVVHQLLEIVGGTTMRPVRPSAFPEARDTGMLGSTFWGQVTPGGKHRLDFREPLLACG